MKKPTLPRLKMLMPQPRKKVSKLAANMARQLAAPPYDDYEDEPTTKLSTAFVVVLMLHMVAVGGIYGFHQIKKSRKEAEGGATADLTAEIKKTSPVPVASQNAVVKAAGAPAPALPKPAPATPQAGVVSAPASVPKSAPGAGAVASAPVVGSGAGAASSAKVPAAVSSGAKAEPAGASAVVPVSRPVVVGSVPQAVGATASANSGGADAGAASTKTYTVQKGDNPVTIAKRLGVPQEELLKLNAIEDPKKLRIGQVLKVPAKKGGN
jgi:LysM repeat protein